MKFLTLKWSERAGESNKRIRTNYIYSNENKDNLEIAANKSAFCMF